MKPRDLGDMFRIAAIYSDLSTTLRLWLRSGRDDCGCWLFLMMQLERAKYRKISESFRAQGKYGKMPGRKAVRTSWKDSSKLDRPFSPAFFRIFTGCFASCLAAKGRRARKRLGERIVWISMLQRESRLFSSSISFRSLGPGPLALVQGRTADDRLWRIFHRR